ncbi:Neutral alpha-glucosidase AB precursor [Paragonimus heterotremus]|uniref:Glucosidase II subunit alpha n=1 Tax=Paragonimus heterotremus TaxID=100268 RepID=A0A8J4T7C4_9TREM|nr:Neutral alpha-glucosidase AB precursor [Paragonimus heterotremus]
MELHRCVFLSFCLSIVVAVNKDNFKSCKLSSFCARQRDVKPGAVGYAIMPDSVKLNAFGFRANLSKTDSQQVLLLDLSYTAFSTFRITLDDVPGHQHERYRIPPGDSLQNEPKRYPINVVKKSDSLILFGNSNDKAVVIFSPFAVNFYVDDILVTQLNRRSFLNFEEASNMANAVGEDSAAAEKLTANSAVIDNHSSPPDGQSSSESDATSENQNTGSTEELTSTSSSNEDDLIIGESAKSEDAASEGTPETPADDPYPWTETFKEHRDTRPYGPMSISLDIDFPSFSHLYGIPEHTDGFVLKSTEGGDPYRLYNLDVFEYELDSRMALYGSVPVVWALNANHTVGLFWHNPSETWVDIGYTDRPTDSFLSKIPRLFGKAPERFANTRWISETGVADVFIMLGRNPAAVAKAYLHLTGSTPLPPLFALGYHQSRWNYNDEQDVRTVDQRFDEHGIPMDVIWLDIEHTDGKRYFTWDKVKFPNPGEMVDKLNVKGRKLVTVVDPHIKQDVNWALYKEGLEQDYFIKARDNTTFIGWCWPGSSAWPDFLSPVVRRWWAELYLKYEPVRANSMFSWNDMGEPSVFSGPEITIHKASDDVIHYGGRENREVHNIYGLHVHHASWEGKLLQSAGQERPFVLSRAFFAGSQRTAAVWTGDNAAEWGHLKVSIPMLLSLSLTGITFCGADVGGFFGNTEPELLVRWFQAAAYQPFFRSHKHLDTKRHEPWTLSEEYMKIVRAAIVERYNLLPYWYTMFARSEADGQPVMAPIWYHFRHLTSVYDLDNEYMIGEAMLVRPVTSAGARHVDVYLPPGVWYSSSTFETVQGDQLIQFPVDLSSTPVFYRGGWIVPRRERIRRSSFLMRNDPFTLFVFLDPAQNGSHGYLYDDDYHSVSRESARFYHITYTLYPDPANQGAAGGRLRMKRIPTPGTTELLERDEMRSSVQYIERIVFVGLQVPIQRATVIQNTSGERRNVEFVQPPSEVADRRYFGNRQAGVVVVQNPGLMLSSDWELHLVTGLEMKAEL